jgi:serine/threonine-protein kinase
MDLMIRLLSQVLNGLGYAHLHRGRDGVVRRLPHLDLRPSKLLMDRDMNVVKLDDCGVMRALFAERGSKKFLWEEFGTDLRSLAPEAFVMETRSLDLLLVDLYALGAMLYRLATGTSMFTCADAEEYKFAHLKKYPVPPRVHRYDIPRWLDAMILKCLEKEPDERWRSATQMELAVGKG